ncbi:MAG: hypothetical protein HFH49_17635 [Lachnospiraceae bacterium]|nr:hypothetical protein [Lachnospiraceae bacterium]
MLTLFGTLGAGAGLFAGIKNTGLFRSVQSTDENGVESTRLVTSIQARRLAQEELNASLARQAAQLEIDTAALKAYETECAKGAVSTEQFAGIMQGASAQAQAYAVETRGAAGSAQAFAARQGQVQAELQATANAPRAGEAAINGLKTAFNMIAFTVIAMGIQMAVTALDNWIHRVERAVEAMEGAKSKFLQTTDEVKSLNDELASTQDKIAQLQELADNGTISVADGDELKVLKETNKELQRKIALKQKEQIDDANDLLKKAREANAEQAYSYVHFNPDGEYVTERKYGDASDQLQDTIRQYQDAVKYFGADGANPENYNV